MGKKKKNKGLTGKGPGGLTRKSSEPTAFELAFRQAEEKKKEAHKEQQKPAPEMRGNKTNYAPSGNDSESKVRQPARETVVPPYRGECKSQKEKRGYIPPRDQKIKQAAPKPAIIKHPSRPKVTPPHPPRATAPKLKKTAPAPINLGFKRTDIAPVSLEINTSIREQSSKTAPGRLRLGTGTGNDQVHKGNPPKESDIVIGFDFGTSSSKLIIRDFGRQTAYAVPFGALACEGNTYLLPTKVYINNDGTLDLSSGEHEYNELKIALMDTPEGVIFEATSIAQTFNSIDLATAYVALAIRWARQWFLQKAESIYRDTYIYWSINLGIPSNDYDDQSAKDSFRIVAMAAWRASRMDGAISIMEIVEHRKEAGDLVSEKKSLSEMPEKNSLWLHPDFVNVHPEVIMEVVGYARSPMRTKGLHLIVDVGATTIDAASFRIQQAQGEDFFPLLETRVERYGTMALHRNRMDALKQRLEARLGEINSVNPNKMLPGPEHYGLEAINQECINEIDQSFFQCCSKVLGEIIRVTKERRDRDAVAWEKGLPVFVCGGGGRLASYKEILESLGERIEAGVTNFAGVVLKEIPKPTTLDAPELPHNSYDRLAVAYGLSFTDGEIGKIIPKSKIVDIQKRERILSYADRYVSKDMC